jgi:PAS domain S-box-containing protein
MPAGQHPEVYLEAALAALSSESDWRSVLDALPAPIYTTDATGAVNYWNRACVEFAGREPQLGRDRWCVTWQLYTTTGDPLAHADCPMAVAVKERRIVRDGVAIAERPDGTRRAFRAYPTPLFDAAGTLTGAVNMLIDITGEQSAALHEQADRCRRLAGALYSREGNAVLKQMAEQFDETAAGLNKSADNDG